MSVCCGRGYISFFVCVYLTVSRVRLIRWKMEPIRLRIWTVSFPRPGRGSDSRFPSAEFLLPSASNGAPVGAQSSTLPRPLLMRSVGNVLGFLNASRWCEEGGAGRRGMKPPRTLPIGLLRAPVAAAFGVGSAADVSSCSSTSTATMSASLAYSATCAALASAFAGGGGGGGGAGRRR